MKHYLITSFLVTLMLSSCVHKNLRPDEGLKVGDLVPEFSAFTLDNNEYTNESFLGCESNFAIVLFSPGCFDCTVLLQQLRKILPDGYPILGLSNQNKDITKEYIETNKFNFLPVAPVSKDIIQSFNKGSMPCLYVFDKSAKVKYVVKNVNLPDNEVLKFLIE